MLYTVVFLLYSKVNQLYYIHPSSLDLAVSHRPPSQPSRSLQSTDLSSLCYTYTVASHWLPVLHMAVYMCKILISQSAPPFLPPLCPHACSLCLCLYFCPADRFICTIFLDSTYMCYYAIFVFLFLTDFTLYNRLWSHPHLCK